MKKKENSVIGRAMRGGPSILVAALLTTSCAAITTGGRTAWADDCQDAGNANICEVVEITFDSDCPVEVDNWAVIVKKTGPKPKVRWKAVNTDGTDNTTVAFQILFDPFVGPPLATTNGVVTSPPVQGTTPQNVLFKYTIRSGTCAALDPFIRIQ